MPTTEYAVRQRADYWGLKTREVRVTRRTSASQVFSPRRNGEYLLAQRMDDLDLMRRRHAAPIVSPPSSRNLRLPTFRASGDTVTRIA